MPGIVEGLKQIKYGFEAKAKILTAKPEASFKRHPETEVAESVENSSGITNQRKTKVYSNSPEHLSLILRNQRRDIIRAMNPHYSELSNDDLDKKVKEFKLDDYFR